MVGYWVDQGNVCYLHQSINRSVGRSEEETTISHGSKIILWSVDRISGGSGMKRGNYEFGWSAIRSAGRSVGRSVSYLVGWSIAPWCLSVSRSFGWSVVWFFQFVLENVEEGG